MTDPEQLGMSLGSLLVLPVIVILVAVALRRQTASSRRALLAVAVGSSIFLSPETLFGLNGVDHGGLLTAIGSLRIALGIVVLALLVAAVRAADAGRSSRIPRYLAIAIAALLGPVSALMGVTMMTLFRPQVPDAFIETFSFNDGRNAISLPDGRWAVIDTPHGKALRHEVIPAMQIECSAAPLPPSRRAAFSRSLEDTMRAAPGVQGFQARVDGEHLVGFSYRRRDSQGRPCAFTGRILYGDDHAVEVLIRTNNDAASLLGARTIDRYFAVVVPRILASAR